MDFTPNHETNRAMAYLAKDKLVKELDEIKLSTIISTILLEHKLHFDEEPCDAPVLRLLAELLKKVVLCEACPLYFLKGCLTESHTKSFDVTETPVEELFEKGDHVGGVAGLSQLLNSLILVQALPPASQCDAHEQMAICQNVLPLYSRKTVTVMATMHGAEEKRD